MATYARNSDRPQKDPTMAGMMSIIPGLGQMYNGETRKGLLFLAVGVINFSLFLGLVFNESILQGLYNFGLGFNMEPNKQLIASMMNMRMGNPASFVLMGLFIAFVAYTMRDAYDHAAVLQRKHIYADAVMDMPEASSGSYLFHIAIMITALILAFFFLIPPPPKVQVTDIEFIQNQPEVKKQIRSRRRAEHNSEDRGKHDPTKKVTPPSPAPKQPTQQQSPRPTPKPMPKPAAQPAPTPTPTPKPASAPAPAPHPTPRPMAAPTPTPTPSPSPSPAPLRTPTPTPTPSPAPMAKMPMAMPNPFAAPTASPRSAPSPVPAPISIGKVGAPAAPSPMLAALPSSSSGTIPAPIASSSRGTSGGGGRSSPVPVFAGGGGGPSGSKGGTGSGPPGPAPAPSRGGGSGSGSSAGDSGPALAVAPSVPRASGGGSPGGSSGEGTEGNPDRGAKPGRPSLSAQKDVDFGPYMADLQRRIKRAWFPPKGNESKRVQVVFKIHTNGTMSNLRLVGSSGMAIADQAALKAVQNAAPFRPLPEGAPPDVDIQFTFDYNVFKGTGGGGVFRRF